MNELDFNLFSHLKDKRKKWNRVDSYVNDGIQVLSSMIIIEGFEEQTGLDGSIFQTEKYTEGMVALYKDGDEFVQAEVQPVGLPRKDLKPDKCILKYYKDNQIVVKSNLYNDKDFVILYNNPLSEPEHDLFRISDVLADVDNSMRLNIRYSKYLPFLRARTQKEKQILEEALKAMDEGKQTVIVDEDLFKDLLEETNRGPDDFKINVTDVRNSDMIQYLTELHESYTRWFFNNYGLYMNGGSKHAQQSIKEIDSGESSSWIKPILFLSLTEDFCRRANEMFGLSLECKFGKVHELLYHQFASECTDETENVDEEEVQDEEELQEVEDELQDEEELQDDEEPEEKEEEEDDNGED